ncbi:MAG: hypothetical protein ACODAQ_07060 [Phycisphaeraceae bacterium]
MSDSHSSDRPVWVKHLSEEDARVLDALLGAMNRDPEAGFAQDRDSRRTERVRALLTLLEALPESEDDPQRVRRTLQAVRNAQQRERFLAQHEPPAASLAPAVAWRQIAAVGLVLVMGLSLLLPVLSRNRAEAQRIACAANLQTVGQAFGSYAADHDGVLPRGHVQPGSLWWLVGEAVSEATDSKPPLVRSNSAHLYLLVRGGPYLDPDTLACPSNPDAPIGRMTRHDHDWHAPREVSYSYQNQYTAEPWRLDDHPDLAVLADKNPLFVAREGRVLFDHEAPVDAPSRGHARRGQNVLTVDGTVSWTVRPFISRSATRRDDNIWLANGIRQYSGNEQPDGHDAFLVP